MAKRKDIPRALFEALDHRRRFHTSLTVQANQLGLDAKTLDDFCRSYDIHRGRYSVFLLKGFGLASVTRYVGMSDFIVVELETKKMMIFSLLGSDDEVYEAFGNMGRLSTGLSPLGVIEF